MPSGALLLYERNSAGVFTMNWLAVGMNPSDLHPAVPFGSITLIVGGIGTPAAPHSLM
jgi:hypothetical protein